MSLISLIDGLGGLKLQPIQIKSSPGKGVFYESTASAWWPSKLSCAKTWTFGLEIGVVFN